MPSAITTADPVAAFMPCVRCEAQTPHVLVGVDTAAGIRVWILEALRHICTPRVIVLLLVFVVGGCVGGPIPLPPEEAPAQPPAVEDPAPHPVMLDDDGICPDSLHFNPPRCMVAADCCNGSETCISHAGSPDGFGRCMGSAGARCNLDHDAGPVILCYGGGSCYQGRCL